LDGSLLFPVVKKAFKGKKLIVSYSHSMVEGGFELMS